MGKTVTWLWAYIKENECITGYYISVNNVMYKIMCDAPVNHVAYTKTAPTGVRTGYTLSSLIASLAGNQCLYTFKAIRATPDVHICSEHLVPLPLTGATEKDIPVVKGNELPTKAWFIGGNADDVGFINYNAETDNIDVSFMSPNVALTHRQGKYINIVGEDNRVVLRTANCRRTRTVDGGLVSVYPPIFTQLYEYYRHMGKAEEPKVGQWRSTNEITTDSIKPYISSYTSSVRSMGAKRCEKLKLSRFPLLQYYGHFGKNRASIAVIDGMLGVETDKYKEQMKRMLASSNVLNKVYYAIKPEGAIGGKPNNGYDQSARIQLLKWNGVAPYVVNGVPDNFVENLVRNVEKNCKWGKQAARYTDTTVGEVVKVNHELTEITNKFISDCTAAAKEFQPDAPEYGVYAIWKAVRNLLIYTRVEGMEQLVKMVDKMNNFVGRDVDERVKIYKDWSRETLYSNEAVYHMSRLISACTPSIEARRDDYPDTTVWGAREVFRYLYRHLTNGTDPHHVIETIGYNDEEAYGAVIEQLNNEAYIAVVEYLCGIMGYFMSRPKVQIQRASWLINSLPRDPSKFVKVCSRLSPGTVVINRVLAKNKETTRGINDWLKYHTDNYIKEVMKTMKLDYNSIKEDLKDLSVRNVIFKICVHLRLSYCNPAITMKAVDGSVLKEPYGSHVFNENGKVWYKYNYTISEEEIKYLLNKVQSETMRQMIHYLQQVYAIKKV